MFGIDEFGPRQLEVTAGGEALDEFFSHVQPWLDERDAQDVVELSQAFRVPAAPVGDGRMMLDYAQFRERPFFIEEDGVTMPGPPYRLGATPAARRGRAPRWALRRQALGPGRLLRRMRVPTTGSEGRTERTRQRERTCRSPACAWSTSGRSGRGRTARCTWARSAPMS